MKRWLILLLLLVAGCRTTHPELEPPSQPEQLVLPPQNDRRYSDRDYAVYPKENREPDYMKKVATPNLMPARGPRGMGGPGGY